eukprot:742785_1
MNSAVLLTITFYGFTTCQFSPLSSSDLNHNHLYSTETMLSCNIASWYSSYHQKSIFMLSYFDSISHGKAPFLTSDLLWFSMNYSYSLSKSFNISDIDTYPIDHYSYFALMDVALSPSSIMVLSQLYNRVSGEQYLFYRVIHNYQNAPSHDIYLSPIRTWKIPNCGANCSSVTASKLYGSDLFIIVYENLNSLFSYLVNESTSYPLSLTPNQLVSQIDILSVHPGSASVNGIKVRASKTSEMYLIVWSTVDAFNSVKFGCYYYTECDHAVRASLHRNDGSVVRSMVDIVSKILSLHGGVYQLYDVISFNISAETGFYAILYYDDQISRLCIRILDDFASDLFGDGTMINVREQILYMMPSATIRVLDLVPPPKHKLYFVVSWSYVEEVYTDQVRPGAVYIQMFEFSWAPSMEPYHLYPVDDPFKVFSTETDRLRKHGMDSVGNQLLVCMDSEYSRKIYTQLLTTTITENPTAAPSKYPSSAPTKHPSDPTVVPTNTPSKAPVTTNKPTNAPTNNPTNSTKEPSRAPIGSEKIIVQKENKKQYLLLLITIPFIIFCAYRMKQYMSFVIVDKALILIIGICEFSGDQLSDLPGIESNVDDLRRLWFDTYRYTVKVCNESTLKCTKRDILRFIDKYKHLLEDASYKAVIVHILSHGSGDDSFMTSDLKTMQTSFVEHELITTTEFAGHPEVIKLIFHHACRGHADYFEAQQIERGSNKFSNKFSLELKEIRSNRECNQNKAGHVPLRSDSSLLFHRKQRKEADAHSNCAVLYGTIEDRALSDDGHFTESICQVFGANSRNLIKRDLYGLIRQIGDDLEDRTHSAQICTSKGIGTLRNKIRFENCTKKMQYWETI